MARPRELMNEVVGLWRGFSLIGAQPKGARPAPGADALMPRSPGLLADRAPGPNIIIHPFPRKKVWTSCDGQEGPGKWPGEHLSTLQLWFHRLYDQGFANLRSDILV